MINASTTRASIALDEIDHAAGLTAASELAALRRQRPEFIDGTEACRQAVLHPKHDNALPPDLRAALAARMARHNDDLRLAAYYDAELAASGAPERMTAIASGHAPASTSDPRTAAILAHADLVTIHPRDCRREDIEALASAGLEVPTIIALSELIAFVNYEARIVAGLRLLEKLP